MHTHAVLTLAIIGVLAAFFPVIALATWLTRRGVLSTAEPGLAFHRWTAPIAGTCSIGAALIHAAVVPDHATEYLPAGVFFAVLAAFQLWWAIAWSRGQRTWLAVLALVVNLVAVAIWVWSRTAGFPLGVEPGAVEPVGYQDSLATLLEVVVAAVIGATLAEARLPRIRRLRLTTLDAFVGAGLTVSAVTAYSVVAVLIEAPH